MKLIIEIPEDSYERVMNPYKFYRDIDGEKIRWAVYKGTPIPDNATVCDIDAIKKRIKYEANVLDTTKGFAYCSGWMDAFKFALDIIDEYTKGDTE